eukprot:363303-Chlamydomonas_euryale.AAC.5
MSSHVGEGEGGRAQDHRGDEHKGGHGHREFMSRREGMVLGGMSRKEGMVIESRACSKPAAARVRPMRRHCSLHAAEGASAASAVHRRTACGE